MDASDRRKHAVSEASDWFSRLQAGPMQRAEREQFVEWLRESHLHVAAMLRVAQIHGSLEQFQGWSRIPTGPLTQTDKVVPFPPPPPGGARLSEDSSPAPRAPPRNTGPRLRFVAFTTFLLLVVGTLTVLPRSRGQLIETERGERREVVLPDGSVLQIDPQTRLRVRYVDAARRISLEQGRALFHVARNANRPFLVQAADTTVRAVGTAFSVEQRPHDGVVVTVAEGKVSVSVSPDDQLGEAIRAGKTNESNSASEASETGNAGEVFLTANQQITVTAGGTTRPIRKVDSARTLAWAAGRLIFQNDELGQAVAQFNRYNPVQLTVADPTLARKPVSGVFNAAEPEAFIAFLQSVTAVEIIRDGDKSITIAAAPSH
jgi:transmembrane sensor